MKKFALGLAGIGITFLFSTGAVLAEDGAIQTMARIVMSLNHFPSDEDKAVMKGIIDSDDGTDEEADIAMVIAAFEHKVPDKDTERLTDIIDDDSADADARNLASILLRINHAPSNDDKAALAALAQ